MVLTWLPKRASSVKVFRFWFSDRTVLILLTYSIMDLWVTIKLFKIKTFPLILSSLADSLNSDGTKFLNWTWRISSCAIAYISRVTKIRWLTLLNTIPSQDHNTCVVNNQTNWSNLFDGIRVWYIKCDSSEALFASLYSLIFKRPTAPKKCKELNFEDRKH